jgi:hypothetical protein
MELQEPPIASGPEPETVTSIEEEEMDRIAFELWQRGSLPEVAAASEAELEDVAAHSSCL